MRLLPAPFRARVGVELLATFEARLADSPTRLSRAHLLMRELAGLVWTVLRTRVVSAAQRAGSAEGRKQGVFSGILYDLRFAVRGMRRSPGVAVVTTLTLALGVGASTTMFSIIDTVLLRPLPFNEPDEIVIVWPTIEEWRNHPSLHAGWQRGRFSAPELLEWLEAQRAFETAGGYVALTARVAAADRTERVPIARATAGLFRVLRVDAQLGRLPADEETGDVVVLTHEFWQSQHGGDTDIVGRDITVNEQPKRVIGVLPPDFDLVGVAAELWLPLSTTGPGAGGRTSHSIVGVGRLREGVGIAQAEAETAALLGGMSAADPGHITHGAAVASPIEEATSAIRLPLLIFATAALLLLLAACANVALVLLGAGADRIRELALRGAIGARKTRIAGQLLVESLALSVVGAAAALLVAAALLRVLVLLAPAGIPRIDEAGIDPRAFAWTAAMAVVTGLVVGCFPAISLSRVEAASVLRAGATAPGRGRMQRTIVVAAMAFATVLLVGAGLLTRTMRELERVTPGFDADGLVTMEVTLPWDRFYRPGVSDEDAAALLNDLNQRLNDAVRTIPGVEEVALTSIMPFSRDRNTIAVEPEGYVPAEGEEIDVARRVVSGNYFDVMGLSPVEGRLITPADDHENAQRVMVVTDQFASHFWPDRRWVGRTVGVFGEVYHVVGIIADTREQDLRGDEDRFKYYVADRGTGAASGNLLIRARIPLGNLLPVLRERVWNVDRSVVITNTLPMTERIADSIAIYRYRMILMVSFSITAALFAFLGIYGVMSRAVARRRHEFGIRLALGATRGGIVSLMLSEGARLGLLGAGLGIMCALASTRAIESMIWGVPRTDAFTFVGVAVVLLALSLLATAYPACRAAAVEPMRSLRG